MDPTIQTSSKLLHENQENIKSSSSLHDTSPHNLSPLKVSAIWDSSSIGAENDSLPDEYELHEAEEVLSTPLGVDNEMLEENFRRMELDERRRMSPLENDANDSVDRAVELRHRKSSSQIPLRESLEANSDEDLCMQDDASERRDSGANSLSLHQRRNHQNKSSHGGLTPAISLESIEVDDAPPQSHHLNHREHSPPRLPRRDSEYLDSYASGHDEVTPHAFIHHNDHSSAPQHSTLKTPSNRHSLDSSNISLISTPSALSSPSPTSRQHKSVSFSTAKPHIIRGDTSDEPPIPPPTGTTMSALSDNMIVKILNYLRNSRELYPILQVSRRFHQLASHDRFWRRTYIIYREKLCHNESQRKIYGLHKRAKKDFRKHYILLKKHRFEYVERSILKREKKTQRKCALILASIFAPVAYIISIVFGFVLFGLYEDGYLLSKILVILPFIIALLLYFFGVFVFLLRETVFFRMFFYDSAHLKQFINLSLAPFPHQIAILCFLVKWGIFEFSTGFLWIYAFIPSILVYWLYYCPCLGALLFSNLRGLHRRRQYVRLKKEHAMELENSVHGDPMTMRAQEYVVDEYNVRYQLSRLKDPNYHLGNDFYLLYFIVSLSVVCTGLMTVLIPLKLDKIIGNPWHVVFIPLWLMSAVFILLIPCWCLYEMLLHGDFKLLGLSILPSLISFPLFASLVLITLKADNIAPIVPLCAGTGSFACWLILSSSAYVFYQSNNLMRLKTPQSQNVRRAADVL